MANHEEEKKKWELRQCGRVSTEMNKQRGTDYDAFPSNAEPADVILKSKSGAHPSLPVRVVSIPVDVRHRDEKNGVATDANYLKQQGA
jgi:hypothetical protein